MHAEAQEDMQQNAREKNPMQRELAAVREAFSTAAFSFDSATASPFSMSAAQLAWQSAAAVAEPCAQLHASVAASSQQPHTCRLGNVSRGIFRRIIRGGG